MIRLLAAGTFAALVAACGATSPDMAEEAAKAPPMPEGAVSETFERAAASGQTDRGVETASSEAVQYWGVKPGEALPIIWDDLMPIGGHEALDKEYAAFYAMLEERYAAAEAAGVIEEIEEGSELDYMPQLGSFETVPELDGQSVRIPGYVVPLDFNLDNRQAEFLFAPYMGACIHTPPPPPNQLIYVDADPAVIIGDMYTAYWIEGTLSAVRQDSSLASAAYTLTLEKIEPY